MTNSHRTLIYGDARLEFDVLRVPRKTMEIAVHPDGRVVVKAPMDAKNEDIEARVIRRARWIRRQQAYFDQFKPRTPPRQYIGGETHRYLGRQYRLKLTHSEKPSVKLSRGHFWIACQDHRNPEEVRRLLWQWFTQRAHEKFSESFDRCWPNFSRLGLPRPTLKIRRMKTRWGSLSESGTLTLNVSLIQAPRECIDYVITHELCHLKHPDHSPAFYRLLEKVMPDWDRRKQNLELSLI